MDSNRNRATWGSIAAERTLEESWGQSGVGVDRRKVLVVEDDVNVCKTLASLIGMLGFPAAIAQDGRQALELVGDAPGRFWLSLVDWVLPGGMNGFQVMARIRTILPECKVVLMSGHERRVVLAEFPDAHPDGFLQKPFRYQVLAAEIRRLQGLRD